MRDSEFITALEEMRTCAGRLRSCCDSLLEDMKRHRFTPSLVTAFVKSRTEMVKALVAFREAEEACAKRGES